MPLLCCPNLWFLGYPGQASQRLQEGLTLAQELDHAFSVAHVLSVAASLYGLRREGLMAREQAEAALAIAREYGFPFFVNWTRILRGWALTEQGNVDEGIAQLHDGLTAYRAIAAELGRRYFLGLLAEACGRAGQAEEGLQVLDEALATAHHTGERHHEAELYRLRGQLLWQHAGEATRRSSLQDEMETSLSAGSGHRPPSASESLGASGGQEPESALAAAGQAYRGSQVTGAGLWLVHRRL